MITTTSTMTYKSLFKSLQYSLLSSLFLPGLVLFALPGSIEAQNGLQQDSTLQLDTAQQHDGTQLIDLQEGGRISLEQAIQVAVANNSDIKRAWFTVLDADELVRIAWADVLPSVSSSATYTRNLEIPVNFLPAEFFGGEPGDLVPVAFGTDNNWQGGVTVSQNIFRGEAIVGISSSSLFKSVQQENLRAVTQQVVTEARKAYYRVLIAQEQLRLQQTTIRRIEANLNENRERNQAGLIDDYEVLRLDVQLANQRPAITEAEFAIEQAYRDLKLVMGLPVDLPFEVTGDLNSYDVLTTMPDDEVNSSIYQVNSSTPLPSRSDIQVMDTMLDRRGDLRLLDLQDQLKEREIKAVKSRFLPTLTANYNLAWTSAQAGTPVFFEDARRFQTLAFTLDFPLFEGFLRRAELNQRLIERRDIYEQQEAAQRQANHEYESAVENLERIFETAEAREQALSQASRGYEIAQQRFDAGLGSQLEVTEAELQVREAELNYSQMVFDFLTTKADYDYALGLVPMADNPEEYFN